MRMLRKRIVGGKFFSQPDVRAQKGETILDVFYYWKEFEDNVKEDMLGLFVSSREQLQKLEGRPPDYIWVFIIPKRYGGQRGKGDYKLKLLATLKWSDTSPRGLRSTGKKRPISDIYYDPEAADSILYEDTEAVEALDLVTTLIRSKYPRAFKPRFRGANGVQVMEKDLVDKFRKETAHYPGTQFLTGITELKRSK